MDFPATVDRVGWLIDQEQFDEARRVLQELAPHLPRPMFLHNQGLIEHRAGNHRQAVNYFRQAIALQPDDPVLHWGLALATLTLGNLEEGFREYEWRLKLPDWPLARNFSQPQWTVKQPLSGKNILLHAEGGLGDSANFARYIPMVAALAPAALWLEAQPAMVPLFRQIPGVTRVFSRGQVLPVFDYQCALPSLPCAFGTTLETIPQSVPYLVAPPEHARIWRERLGRRQSMRFGIAWCGSGAAWPKRSRTLSIFAPLAQFAGAEFHSLQLGAEALEPRPPGFEVIDHSRQLFDMGETAALVDQMDLIISIDSAVAHLAGAMGKPIWVLVSRDACFRYLLDRTDSPWYPAMRLFRQTTQASDWSQVVGELAEALRENTMSAACE